MLMLLDPDQKHDVEIFIISNAVFVRNLRISSVKRCSQITATTMSTLMLSCTCGNILDRVISDELDSLTRYRYNYSCQLNHQTVR